MGWLSKIPFLNIGNPKEIRWEGISLTSQGVYGGSGVLITARAFLVSDGHFQEFVKTKTLKYAETFEKELLEFDVKAMILMQIQTGKLVEVTAIRPGYTEFTTHKIGKLVRIVPDRPI